MLCSHTKKFIYFKTIKTAGTSVEIFFEKYCLPQDHYHVSHAIKETITAAGIVGSRLDGRRVTDKFYNHMPAKEVLFQLGDSIFNTYYKFAVIRNPFDKTVSMFWWALFQNDKALYEQIKNAPFNEVKEYFYHFLLKKNALPLDQNIYSIDNQATMDTFLRFENLHEEMARVCKLLDVPFDITHLGNYKNNIRAREEHFSKYYDDESAQIIKDHFQWELDYFGYSKIG